MTQDHAERAAPIAEQERPAPRARSTLVQEELAIAAEQLTRRREAIGRASASGATPARAVIVHRYWFVDERTGKEALSSHMTAEDAAKRYPEAKPEPSSREKRWQAAPPADR